MALEKLWPALGFILRYISGEWVVTAGYISQLKSGDIIERINGKKFEEFYQEKRKYINASSDREARVKFLFRAFLFPEKFTLEIAGGKKIEINRKTQKFPRPERKTSGRWIRKGAIAYIKIPDFESSDSEKDALEFVKKFSKANVLIVDVRGNGGGNTPGELVDTLQDRPYRFWAESTPISFALFKTYQELFKLFKKHLPKDYKTAMEMFSEFFGDSHLLWTPSYKKPERTIFKGKLIILADRACVSVCEDFVVPFKDNGRAEIIGEVTMGSSGQPYIYLKTVFPWQ